MSAKPSKETMEVVAPTKDPAVILDNTSVARTLTISDQHATLLLTTKDTAGSKEMDDSLGEKKALLKLMLVPFHKTDLLPPRLATIDGKEGAVKPNESDVVTEKAQQNLDDIDHSRQVLDFLSNFDWKMTSESGAEYSYHDAFYKTGVGKEGQSPAAKKAKIESSTNEDSARSSIFKVELIYPASERQVARAMPSPGFSMIMETPHVYRTVTKPFIDKIVSSGSLSWLKNIVEVKKEEERLLWNADGWILNIDTKWRSHPPALTVPRQEWFQHESIADLYCLGIFKDDGVATLRDLRGTHLPILREMLDQGPTAIEQIYGVPQDQLRIFVHYQPQFYHFHVHFTRLENDIGAQVEKAHLLSDIIQDLEADPDCFQKKTMTYKLSLKDKLYHLLKDQENGTTKEE